MNISVIGTGRWGSFLAWYNDHIGNTVTHYGLESAPDYQQLKATRSNGMVTLPDSVTLTSDIHETLKSEIIIISIGSQNLRSLMKQITDIGVSGKTFVLCMKGIEIESGNRLTQIVKEYIDSSCHVAVWIGPGHVQEFVRGVPNCMVIDSEESDVKERLISVFSSNLIRFYYGNDLIGNEIGAAAKNVIGIASGVLDALNLSALKGALMSRGTREISRLIKAMGGNELSAYGLCHLGDYEATVFSKFSHNRQFGESYVKGEAYTKLAEGYYTAAAIKKLADKYGVELPICTAVYDMLYDDLDANEAVQALFLRSLKMEI